MPQIVKIMNVDREFEKLTDVEMLKYMEEYMQYCLDTYNQVKDHSGVSDKDARNAIYERLLSPFQYFLEDRVRMKRAIDGRFPPVQYPNKR
jgi:hypothetical protein